MTENRNTLWKMGKKFAAGAAFVGSMVTQSLVGGGDTMAQDNGVGSGYERVNGKWVKVTKNTSVRTVDKTRYGTPLASQETPQSGGQGSGFWNNIFADISMSWPLGLSIEQPTTYANGLRTELGVALGNYNVDKGFFSIGAFYSLALSRYGVDWNNQFTLPNGRSFFGARSQRGSFVQAGMGGNALGATFGGDLVLMEFGKDDRFRVVANGNIDLGMARPFSPFRNNVFWGFGGVNNNIFPSFFPLGFPVKRYPYMGGSFGVDVGFNGEKAYLQAGVNVALAPKSTDIPVNSNEIKLPFGSYDVVSPDGVDNRPMHQSTINFSLKIGGALGSGNRKKSKNNNRRSPHHSTFEFKNNKNNEDGSFLNLDRHFQENEQGLLVPADDGRIIAPKDEIVVAKKDIVTPQRFALKQECIETDSGISVRTAALQNKVAVLDLSAAKGYTIRNSGDTPPQNVLTSLSA